MFGSIKEMCGLRVETRDGPIGRLNTLYFGEDDWMTQALGVSSLDLPAGREWLVPPGAVTLVDPANGRIALRVTRPQLEQAAQTQTRATGGRLLHSCVDLLDGLVVATDGAVGHLDDLLLDSRNGQIRFAVIDTHRRRPDRRVLIRTSWLHDIDALRRQVRVMVKGAVIEACPAYALPRGASDEPATFREPAPGRHSSGQRAPL